MQITILNTNPLPIAHSYFDNMLKKNGAYDKRFAQPYLLGGFAE